MIFGTANAIPAGNIPLLCENAYQQALKPFLTTIYNHPALHFTLYYSGSLLEWLERHHAEFHSVLVDLVSKKQNLELLGGAYWEPILPLVQSRDRTGQIEAMTTLLRKNFGKRPRGSWVPAQIWESHLSSNFYSNNMKYVFLSEKAFPIKPGEPLTSPVISEDQGKTVIIFPVMDSLSERFLKEPPQQIIEFLHSLYLNSTGEKVVSLLLDGLSLGVNGSHSVCYKEQWLEKFLHELENAAEWLECILPGQYIRSTGISREKVYLPTLRYNDLMHWIQPSGTSQSSYRSFLTKYRESSLLYAKMMFISTLTSQLRGDKSRKKTATEELWRAQEHHAYWHGPSGGIYNSRLRHHAYEALIEAEKATREKGLFKPALIATDFDMDGDTEFIYSGMHFNASVHSIGAALFEFDYLPVSRNYLATFSHYEESYRKTEKPPSAYSSSYHRHAFIDHILHPDDNFESFEGMSVIGKTSFPSMRYTQTDIVRDQARLSFMASSPLNSDEDEIQINKTYRFLRNILEIQYTLTNLTLRTLNFTWGVEINLALDEDPLNRSVYINTEKPQGNAANKRGIDPVTHQWAIFDENRSVLMHFVLTREAELWRFPCYMDFRIEKEMQNQYQSSFFMPRWNVTLAPQSSLSTGITMHISRFKKQD